jgi:hypothetical protein
MARALSLRQALSALVVECRLSLFDRAFAGVETFLAAERLKRERQPGLSEFVRRLQAKL